MAAESRLACLGISPGSGRVGLDPGTAVVPYCALYALPLTSLCPRNNAEQCSRLHDARARFLVV